MKVLFISISAPPKNSPESIQTGKFIKSLSRKYNMTLLTTASQKGWAPEDKGLSHYLNYVKSTIEVATIPFNLIKILEKIVPSLTSPDHYGYFHWLPYISIKKIKQPDIIISRSTPFSSAVLALKLKNKYNVPWIMHLSDPWIDNPFYNRPKNIKAIDIHWEKQCFENADIITFTSKKTIDFYSRKYPNINSKFRWLPNVYDANDISIVDHSFDGKMRIVFTGRLYGTRNPILFIAALTKLRTLVPDIHEKIEFIFAGFADELSERLLEENTDIIKYLGHVTQKESKNLQNQAHLLLVIDSLEADPRYDMFLPSKVLDYLISGKKIIAITRETSSTCELVEKSGGKCFNSEMTDSLAEYLLECLENFNNKDKDFFSNSYIPVEYELKNNVSRLKGWINSTSNK